MLEFGLPEDFSETNMQEAKNKLNFRGRPALLSITLLLASGCDNVIAQNFENMLVWNGLDREIAQWVPMACGVLGAYLGFRFMLGDTRKY